jgi:hypothetical protein
MTRTANFLTLVLVLGGVLAAGRAAMAAFPTAVNDQITDSMAANQKNKHGSVDAGEWQAADDRAFAAIDADHDGTISRAEFAKFRDAVFPAMDADHDGEVSAAEADAYKRLPWTPDVAH